jgi:PAS domain S-box-containing protein
VEYHAGAIVKENNVAGVQINIRDVTERKKTEELLRESEERFRGLFESIQDPVGIFVGKEGQLIDYNTAFKKSSGYTDEELKGKVFLDFVHPEDHAMVLEKYRTEYSEDEFPMIYEIRGVNKKGECIPLELSVSTYKKKGKVIGIEVIHRDLTERKKAEMSLRESQGRFEGLFIGNPEAAAYLGPDYRIQDVNPRFEKLFGYSLEEVKGKHINDVVVPTDRRKEGEALDRDARKGYVYRNTVRRKKDGSLVQVSVSAAPITNESGVTGIVAMYKDISDLKNAEKRLDVMNEKLRVVGSLTRHDMRNKLTAVNGNAYLLRKRFAGDSDAMECLKSVESAVRESERIFDFASAYEKLGVEQLTYVDAKKVLDEAVALFPDLKDVKIVNDCGGLTLLADSLLRQLFYNLIDNSLKYGKKLTQIRIRYEKSENQLKLVYEDDGVGISKDNKAKIFNEGFTTGKGSGYGLYLVRRMMDVYGWTIQETGTPDNGVCFTIVIPEKNQDGKENYQLH